MLPEFYKRWVVANPESKRTPQYFIESFKAIREILKYICTPEVFLLAEPAFVTRYLINLLEHNLKVVELTMTPEKDIVSTPIKKLMVLAA